MRIAEGIELPNSFDEARAVLMPRALGLVPFQIRGQALAMEGVEGAIDSAIPIVSDYYLGAILDLPAADVPVTTSMLDTWGVDMESVVDAARETRADAEATVNDYGAAWAIVGMPFVAAALCEPAAVTQLRDDATAVIIVPTPDIVIVGYAEDEASLISAAVAAEQAIANSERTVSITPLVASDGAWSAFEWPEAVQAEAGKLRRRWDNVQYESARPVLQETYGAAGQDVFVGEHVLTENAAGDWMTYTTVMELRMVIPAADTIVLTADDGRTRSVPFAQVAALDGVLVPAPGTVPDYFVVSRFPNELL